MDTVNYWSKSEPVKAIRVTLENMNEIVLSCREDIKKSDVLVLDMEGDKPYIYLVVRDHYELAQRTKAFVGDWVVLADGMFATYTHEVFSKKFATLSEELSEDDQYNAVYAAVRSAMGKQDTATYFGESSAGMDVVAAEAAKQILRMTGS